MIIDFEQDWCKKSVKKAIQIKRHKSLLSNDTVGVDTTLNMDNN